MRAHAVGLRQQAVVRRRRFDLPAEIGAKLVRGSQGRHPESGEQGDGAHGGFLVGSHAFGLLSFGPGGCTCSAWMNDSTFTNDRAVDLLGVRQRSVKTAQLSPKGPRSGPSRRMASGPS